MTLKCCPEKRASQNDFVIETWLYQMCSTLSCCSFNGLFILNILMNTLFYNIDPQLQKVLEELKQSKNECYGLLSLF